MANPFDRNKTKEAKLGALITEPGQQNQRDAVHIAVVPIMATTSLRPGQEIGVCDDGNHSDINVPPVGIVDPYLKNTVNSGETFWLFLFQGSVTTLRHEWTHPAFPNADGTKEAAPTVDTKLSEEWLKSYAAENNIYATKEVAYQNLLEGLRKNEIFFHGTDLHSFNDLPDPRQLEYHARIVLGRPIIINNETSFSCSC